MLAHGVTGTWLDEIVEVGVPLAVFIALYIWSSRKEKRKPDVPAGSKAEVAPKRQ